MRKITILLPNLKEGGAEKMRLVLAKELAKTNQVEFLLLSKKGGLLNLVPEEIPVKTLNVIKFRNVFSLLISYIRKEEPDILLAAMWPLTVIASLATFLSFKKTICIVSEHGILSEQYSNKGIFKFFVFRASMAIAYRIAHKTVGVSKGVVEDIAYLSCISSKDIELIYNPAQSCNEFDFNCKDLGFAKDIPVIITVGRYTEVKNHFLLIEAFSLLRNKIKSKLYIVGDGELRDEYSELIKSLNLEQDVVLTGFVSDPTPYYVCADLFVLSSDSEGFGNVIVEAMSVGTPIVSTDCKSGPREILEDGKYGTLVPVDDPEALTQAMLEALQQKHDKEALKRRAADFSVDKIAKQYIGSFQ
ncbi:glycosyltransferase [Denitrificimonas sp. JX-1]|uniref:Glycosyltransferase n=1 Tax=Denitrificimonas halotolerans TaxID=3098930 RepID=A0ABU5GQZ7_9GAMM|nr:glycosyltransferase [Denitrificimonas sp. JX-1]MDY7219414.1 glycosyltransferase [Denitrificimonas sp. JX-1]